MGIDGHGMLPTDDTGKDLWLVAGVLDGFAWVGGLASGKFSAFLMKERCRKGKVFVTKLVRLGASKAGTEPGFVRADGTSSPDG